MKKFVCMAASVLCIAVFLSGCATPFPMGMLYTEIQAPSAVGNDVAVAGKKVGVSKSISVLGLVAVGDGSIKTAMANGKITKVKYVEYSVKNILGIYGEYITTVYGD